MSKSIFFMTVTLGQPPILYVLAEHVAISVQTRKTPREFISLLVVTTRNCAEKYPFLLYIIFPQYLWRKSIRLPDHASPANTNLYFKVRTTLPNHQETGVICCFLPCIHTIFLRHENIKEKRNRRDQIGNCLWSTKRLVMQVCSETRLRSNSDRYFPLWIVQGKCFFFRMKVKMSHV